MLSGLAHPVVQPFPVPRPARVVQPLEPALQVPRPAQRVSPGSVVQEAVQEAVDVVEGPQRMLLQAQSRREAHTVLG